MNYAELVVRSLETKRNTEEVQCGLRKSDVDQIGGFDSISSKKKLPKSVTAVHNCKTKE